MRLHYTLLALLPAILSACSGSQQCDAKQAREKMVSVAGAFTRTTAGTSDLDSRSSKKFHDGLALMRELINQGKFVEACAKGDELGKVHGLDLTRKTAPTGQLGRINGQHNIGCSLEDAAAKQKQVQDILQAEVDAGRKGPEIFESFNEDIRPLADMMSKHPSAACNLLDRLIQKYSLLSPHEQK